jgi:hypothetical protein
MLARAFAAIAAFALASAAAAQPARPDALRTFRDWTVGCDNGGRCKAVALAPADGSPDEWPPFMLSIERDAGPGGAVAIGLAGQEDAPPPIAVLIDGRPAATMRAAPFTGTPAIALARALAAGSRVRIEAGGRRADHSLSGLSAALRYIDDRQKRAGTVGALVARGSAPDRAAAPALPMIRAIPGGGRAATLPPARIAALRKGAGCSIADGRDDPPGPEYYTLGGGETLMLLPCDMGAYNMVSAIFVIGRGGATRPADIDPTSGRDPDRAVPLILNPTFERGTLWSDAKGRGIGDCGIAQDFVWDGRRFRLAEQNEMAECRGSTDRITTWRTLVR